MSVSTSGLGSDSLAELQPALLRLSAADQQIAALLSEGRTQTDVAQVVGVTRETVCRKWAADSNLRRATRVLAAERIQTSLRRTSVSAGKAIDRLEKLLQSDDEPVALSAAKALLAVTQRCEQALAWSLIDEALQTIKTDKRP